MLELFQNFVAFYNKLHHTHIQTVKMTDCYLLHKVLGEHYETLQDIVDTFGEDILVKGLNISIPSALTCLQKSIISTQGTISEDENILLGLSNDVKYLITDISTKASAETNLLIQNILIDIRNKLTIISADYDKLTEDTDDMGKSTMQRTLRDNILSGLKK